MRISRVLSVILLVFTSHLLWGQSQSLDYYRNSGKIYVVVAVIVVSFLGIVLFLISLDRRIRRMEKDLNQK
ncbi:MAG: CcmD family protein [Saprospiraceae bacterium]|nr:CcmD family protein [Saprospiraceae bacterium]MCB9318660.1 CcmD family protein [Lewinellaceae bacterium]